MKKLYSLILLGGLLFFGVQSTFASIAEGSTLYLKMTNNWENDNAKIAVYFFNSASEYAFSASYATSIYPGLMSIVVPDGATGDVWNNIIVVRYDPSAAAVSPSWNGKWNQTGNIDITSASGDCLSGFDMNDTKGTLSTLVLNNYSVSFVKPAGWTKVYAYVWKDATGGRAKVEPLGAWSSVAEVSADANGIYTVAISSDVIPANIIWKDGGSNQTGDLTFVDGATYDKDGELLTEVTLSNVDAAAKGFATFCGKYNYKVSGATAYKASYSAGVFTLTAINSSNEIIGKEEGIILAGTKAETATISYTTAAKTASTEGNVLLGVTGSTNYADLNESGTKLIYAINKTTNNFQQFVGTLPANKAYYKAASSLAAPSAIRIADEENGATNIDAIDASEEAVKFFQNGKLFIKKNGVVYDMMGAVVK